MHFKFQLVLAPCAEHRVPLHRRRTPSEPTAAAGYPRYISNIPRGIDQAGSLVGCWQYWAGCGSVALIGLGGPRSVVSRGVRLQERPEMPNHTQMTRLSAFVMVGRGEPPRRVGDGWQPVVFDAPGATQAMGTSVKGA